MAATDHCQISCNLADFAVVADLDVNKSPAVLLIPVDVGVLRRNGLPVDFPRAQALRLELGIFLNYGVDRLVALGRSFGLYTDHLHD